ncbi:hypothetical protein [Halobellus ruber]|uniref:Uncharacterized protein n=1 Tax=Halobellus ruber TaxID=2761102 RepID=A0A7J9SEN4_9EURY|nr:hypothetical protein [Halobellus ruber]MBB6645380.1 hypothetical protein [Halobellus ruber]
MSLESEGSEPISDLDASLKTQDKPIIDAFSHAKHQVLLTTEVAERVELSDRQVRRRLKDLASRDILGTRKPGRDRLWWLKRDVREPITAQYPLLRFARDRTGVQLLLAGLGIGVIALVLVPIASLTYAYNVSPPLITREVLLQWGLLASILASGFLIAAVIAAMTGWLLRRANIDVSDRFTRISE